LPLLRDAGDRARVGLADVHDLTVMAPLDHIDVFAPNMHQVMGVQIGGLFEHGKADVLLPPPLQGLAQVRDLVRDLPLADRIWNATGRTVRHR
jgi:hypothetical protein